MPIIDGLLLELDQEAQTTRRLLERINDDHLTWRPHAKARTLGELALHVAMVPGAIAELAMQDQAQAPKFVDPSPNSSKEILATHDDSIAKAMQTLSGVSDERLKSPWRLMQGDRELFLSRSWHCCDRSC